MSTPRLDPRTLAKQQADWAQIRHLQHATERRTEEIDHLNHFLDGLASYAGYNAETGSHFVQTRTGTRAGKYLLTNSGLQPGQPVEFAGEAIDATPRRQIEAEILPVLGGEELAWAGLLRIRRFLFDAVVPEGAVPYWRTEYWLWTTGGLRELLRFNDFEETLVNGGPSTPRPSLGILGLGEDGLLHADFRIYYGDDPFGFDSNRKIWVLEVERAASEFIRLHFQIRSGGIVEVSQSESWRAVYTNQPGSFFATDTARDFLPPQGSPCTYAYQFLSLVNLVQTQRRLYIASLVEIPIATFFPGATLEVPVYSFEESADSCEFDFDAPQETITLALPPLLLNDPPVALATDPEGSSSGSSGIDTLNRLTSLVVAYVS